MNSARSILGGYLAAAALSTAVLGCQNEGTSTDGSSVNKADPEPEPSSETETTEDASTEDGGALASPSSSTGFPFLTCDSLSAKYRECGLLGEGDFECTGHLDACTALCELQASCEDLSDLLCWTLDNNSPVWLCLFDCDAGPGGYICEEDGMAIPIGRFCDGVEDCKEGSDEQTCPAMVCDSMWNNVIVEDRICDGVEDCFGGEDEEGCPDFVCDDGSALPHGVQCDETSDCFDRSDERYCDFRMTSVELCDGELLSEALSCDGIPDCSDGSDENGCDDSSECSEPDCGRSYVFVCGDGSQLPSVTECDQVIDCDDASDEACSSVCADGELVSYLAWCDEVVDCADGSDETDCDSSRCDGFRDHDDWSDEIGCCDDPPCAELTACEDPLPTF